MENKPERPRFDLNAVGQYDEECTQARIATEATSVLLIVIKGKRGDGFTMQTADVVDLLRVPEILRKVADQIEQNRGGASA